MLVTGLILCGWVWRRHLWHPYTHFSPVLYPIAGGLFAVFILWAFVNPGHWLAAVWLAGRYRSWGRFPTASTCGT